MEKINYLLSQYTCLSIRDKAHLVLRLLTMPWKRIIDIFPEGETLVDIGCGHGVLINMLKNKSCFKKLIGYDPDERKILIAQQTADNRVRFSAGNILMPDLKADVYSIFDVLYLVPFNEQEVILKQVFISLPLGGHLVIKEVGKKPFWKFCFACLQESIVVKVFNLTKGKSFYFHTEEEFEQLLTRIGFLVQKNQLHKGFLYPHVMYICKKGTKVSGEEKQ